MRRLALAMVFLAGCSSEMQPAQRVISDIDRSMRAAAPEAARYVPDQLRDVEAQVGTLKTAFGRNDYTAVLEGAPKVMSAAQALDGAAAAKKNAILRALIEQWSTLAAALPDEVAAIEGRIDVLGRNAGHRTATGIDLEAARARLSRGAAMWSKAQAAFATGNMDEAVAIAKNLDLDLQTLASALEPQSAGIAAPASPR